MHFYFCLYSLCKYNYIMCLCPSTVNSCNIYSISNLYRRFHTKSAGDWMQHFEKEFASIPVLVCLTHADKLYEDNFKSSIPVCQPNKLPEIQDLVKQELKV